MSDAQLILAHQMITNFHLSPEDRARMDNYFILHWQAVWFQKVYAESQMVKKDGIVYMILFDDDSHEAMDPGTREVALSFRFCKEVNNVHGYVIVKKVK